ncbi:MAG: NACHT domain-containing protein, partial [Candidatus Hodarchaeota archaeon]
MDELIKIIGSLISIAAGVTGLFIKVIPWIRKKQDQYSLEKRFGAELYSKSEIENALKYYIEPYCQTLDPSGGEEPRHILGTKQNIFDVLDEALTHTSEYRYIILLADSGMGKTTFLLNYYVRHLKLRRNKFKIEVIPLGIPDVEDRIEKIQNHKDTVLFLDAFDEDTKAYNNHKQRLDDLVKLTRNFNRVLITCRTQFFSKDEEIPQETGIVIIGPRPAGTKAQHVFHKLYLSPFTDEQIRAYLKNRYSLLHIKIRKKAYNYVKKIHHLCVRPMLLAYLPNLLDIKRKIFYSYELYEEMIEAWLIREEGII